VSDISATTERLEVAHVLFIDLVGYSRQSLEVQHAWMDLLQDVVRAAPSYREAKQGDTVLSHPAGDGMALAFFRDPSLPARCAVEIGQALSERGGPAIRSGIHSGPVYRAEDINHTSNVRGPGINLAQRVMDQGDAGHVLVSYTTADVLNESQTWSPYLHALGEYTVKHGVRLALYGLEMGGVGTSTAPAGGNLVDDAAADGGRQHNLPVALTSFVGRDTELSAIKQRLSETRLLTLTGVGGAGKTRTALRVAADVLDDYSDGVWFIDLSGLHEPSLIPQALAAVFGVRDSTEQELIPALLHFLEDRLLLIVLDNCEHVLAEAGDLARQLLLQCPDMRILTTSRELLGIEGEALWPLSLLSVPDEGADMSVSDVGAAEAVQLFATRGRDANPSFMLTDENSQTIADICRQLDGIPLAIELAAARLRMMSAEQIRDRLDDRFRLLASTSWSGMQRQRTLRALIDWSYQLLDARQQVLFARLSVFPASFTLEAAEACCAEDGLEAWEVMDVVLELGDRSLVAVVEANGNPRYRLLATLREYAAGRLEEIGETEALSSRHAEHYASYVADLRPSMDTAERLACYDLLDQERDNIQRALRWFLDHGEARGLKLLIDRNYSAGPVRTGMKGLPTRAS